MTRSVFVQGFIVENLYFKTWPRIWRDFMVAANQTTKYENYDEVVFYRKAWVWGLLLVLLTPVAVVIGLTGDVYRLQEGQLTIAPRSLILTASIGFGLLALLKIFGPMFIHP